MSTFLVIRNFSELTGTTGIGTGPDMALGATPSTRRKRKKVKVEFIAAAARVAVPLARRRGKAAIGGGSSI